MDIWKQEWGELLQTAYNNAADGLEKSDSTRSIDQVFATILQLWVSSIKVKDEWEFYLSNPENTRYYYGTARSKKFEEDFTFGLYDGKLYLDISFVHPYRLQYMSDEFWAHLIELDKCGNCSFIENAGLGGEGGKISKKYTSSKSNIFNIVKNYLLLEIYGEGSGDLGGIEVMWPMDVDKNELLLNGATAVYHMYKMNYLLYRSYNQYLSSWKKKHS
ncbi:hypothetical protein [Desulfovibrio sp. JC010]|uniref:hypothetical protein n=1 Tax=Desulfovibrio sp. JC010 TaxID=2593641 RepID=UPI0013D2365E|nr:hypothetical protein [Desulfovibrio sp. JC010]NDV28579.1 hypothetical protein [Desulfovibrio sp. JC010]